MAQRAAATPARRAPADGLADAMVGVSRVMVAMTARSVAQLDVEVTLVQYRALVLLAGAGPTRTGDLAAALGVAPSTATRTCDRLVRKGLVQRYRRPVDRRVTWITLAPPGRDLVGTVMRRRRAAVAELVGGLRLDDPTPLVEMLEAFVAAAGEPPEREWWRRWRRSARAPEDAIAA
jgi:DNA-binding MarR family transcriptional regulator